MSGFLSDNWKAKKQKKQKFFAASFIGDCFAGLINDGLCDFIRFDMHEAAKLFGFGDGRRITVGDCDFLLKNRQKSNTPFVSDLPLPLVTDNNAVALTADFVGRYRLDAVNLYLNNGILALAKKLTHTGIPVIVTVDAKSLVCNEDRIIENAVEAGNTAAAAIITEGLSEDVYDKIKSMCKIPVLADRLIKNADGCYFRYGEVIGLTGSANQYLNANRLINGAFVDAAESLNVK